MTLIKTFKLSSCALLCSLMLSAGASAEPVSLLGLWESPTIAPDAGSYIYEPAPKGGTLRLGGMGAFDSFNPFSPRGVKASHLSLTYETLGESIGEEEFIVRAKLAESFDLSDDRLSMIVKLRNEASFSDGKPVTAADVVWSFEHLIKDASPVYRNHYHNVTGAEAIDATTVKFTFADAKNRSLPLIIAQMPVLPAHWWKDKNLGDPVKTPMPGSGPYVYESWDMGAKLTLKRNPDWWGAKLPEYQGRYNFDRIDVDYFREFTVMRQAFFSGNLDFFTEIGTKNWKMAYDVPPVREGLITREEVAFGGIWGMSGVFMNTRKPYLADIRVRQALSLMFNFERVNRTIFFDSYRRIEGFWTGSKTLSATDPISPEEEAILRSLPGINPDDFLTLPERPKHKATATSRSVINRAIQLLGEAGWTLKNGVMTNAEGEALQLNLIMPSPGMVRLFTGWAQDMKRIGVDIQIQALDQVQYINRVRSFDYDLTMSVLSQTNNPSNEQRHYFGSQAADEPNSRNYAGIKSEAVDALLKEIVSPESRASQIAHVKVLDRILQNGYYVIPSWYNQTSRVAWWKDNIVPPRGKIPQGERVDVFSWHKADGNVNR